jgi:hypothetical protein
MLSLTVPPLRCRHSARSRPTLPRIDSLGFRRGPLGRAERRPSRWLRRCAPWLLALAWLPPAAPAVAQQDDLAALLRQSQFVFQGTIQKLGAATEPHLPVDDRTAVVRVEQVLRAPDLFRNLKGRAVTVQLRRDLPAKGGDSGVFFTRSWIYGESLAVVEVGRMDARYGATLPAQIRDAESAAADEKLGRRVAQAQLIVLGRVRETHPAPPPERKPPVTEHDPVWWEATIEIRSVEKGERPRALKVLFPASTDEMWIDTPKLRRGMTVLLLLQRDQQEKGMPLLRRPGWTALDPLDVLPPEQAGRVRRLAEAPRPGRKP